MHHSSEINYCNYYWKCTVQCYTITKTLQSYSHTTCHFYKYNAS